MLRIVMNISIVIFCLCSDVQLLVVGRAKTNVILLSVILFKSSMQGLHLYDYKQKGSCIRNYF